MRLLSKTCQKTGALLNKLPAVGSFFEPKPKIAVVRLSGVIMESQSRRQKTLSHHRIANLLDDAFELSKLQAVALVINSPGGSPAQSSLIADHIRELADKHEVPVYAFIEDVAASGGYWIACAADQIYAQPSSITGSIGVISASFGLDDFIKRYDISRRVHTSGKDKEFLDPFQPEKESDIKRLKEIQKKLHNLFIGWVKARRGEALNGTDKTLFEGQFWIGPDAVEKGIIDGLGGLKPVLKEKYGDEVKFVSFEDEPGFFASLLGANGPSDILSTVEHRLTWQRFGL